jgi:hypothetical protein
MSGELIKSLIQKIRQAGERSGSRVWLIVALGIGLLVDIGLFFFNLVVPNVANVIAAVVILLSPAIFVLIGFDRARQDDPIRNLFEHQPNAVKAPYLLACAVALQDNPNVSARDKREALEELASEIHTLKDENLYIHSVIAYVETHAVWAVCGKKTGPNASRFYEANETSFRGAKHSDRNGNYIERAFLPPTTAAEAESIKEAIERCHFRHGMLVRALRRDQDADEVRHSHNFPPGFGMTIMGERKRRAGDPEGDPDRKDAVLVHWGGLDYRAGTHYGVVLKHGAWLAYFWDVFEQIRVKTEIVNPGGASPTWSEFVQAYPRYRVLKGIK